ncbi:MAG: hypothetical protein A4E42_00493 [Methanoregulaceae archaeon PtaU1.Bin222]|nr:MAG: hypothetical protein A4E42_00493 [Methanoregulaceae archaeon PtaU1.Bin222]
MNPAQVPVFRDTAEEWADSEIAPGIRIAHLHRVDLPEIRNRKVGAGNPVSILTACHEEPEYIIPPAFKPCVEVFDRGCYPVTENLAAEPALEAVFRVLFYMADTTIPW